METKEKKGDGEEKKEEEMKWWQLKRMWFGFFIIIFVIAFGIAQPFLWYSLFEKYPPNGVMDIANLLLILITLLAVGLTGFSVLIYESLQTRITQGIKRTGDEVEKKAHMHIEEHVEEVFRRHEELSERTEKEAEIRQSLFRAQMLRIVGFTFWQLFLVWEEVKVKNSTPDLHAKEIFKDLITIAIERAKRSLDFAKKIAN